MTEFSARARANIALSKYWGKADRALNLPAVPSLSLTLDDLVTETTAARDGSLPHDHIELDGVLRAGDEAKTLGSFLALVRARAGVAEGAPGSFLRVRSFNRFPTASGLASSASGYAALAAAASAAYGLRLDDGALRFDMIEARVSKLEDHVNRLYGGLVLASIVVPVVLRFMEK